MRGLKWLWLGVLLAGCPEKRPEVPDAGPVVTGPEQLEEKEPNERPEQALTLSRDAVVSAGLKADPSRPDEDWYRLAPGAPRVADVTVSGLPGGDIVLEVYEGPGARSASINSGGDGKPERFPNLYVERERWVRVLSARKGTGGAYTLEVRYHPAEEGLEHEPNDRAVDGHVLALGQTVTGFLGHAGDEDWYRLELPEPPGGAQPPPPPSPGTPGEAPPAPPGPPRGARRLRPREPPRVRPRLPRPRGVKAARLPRRR